MASNPDEARSRQEESAAALLLLGASYNLPQLIRTAKVKPRPFRRIAPTEALRSSVAAPYFDLVRAWQAERDDLLRTYARLVPVRGGPLSPDAADELRRAVDQSAARVERRLAQIRGQFGPAFAQIDRWHRAQWLARINSATGINVAVLTTESATRPDVETAVSWNEHLAGQVHLDIKGAVATALLGAMAIRAATTPAEGKREEAARQREVKRQARGAPGELLEPEAGAAASAAEMLDGLLAKAKKRVARIAVDQTDKVSADMDRARRREAGLGRFRWHHTHQLHPRPEHRRRDKRVYSQATAPNDRAGTLPFCKCWEEPLWD
jgi:hypothetical protein